MMSKTAVPHIAGERGLSGINHTSLINYAQMAESHYRWSEVDLNNLLVSNWLMPLKSEPTWVRD